MYSTIHPLSRDFAGEFLAMNEDAQRQHLRTKGGMTEHEIDLRLLGIRRFAILLEAHRTEILKEDAERNAQIIDEVMGWIETS